MTDTNDDPEDGTTAFGDEVVDGFVFVQSTDSPELRSPRDGKPFEPRITYRGPAPERTVNPEVGPWSPGPPPAPSALDKATKHGVSGLRTPLRIAGGLLLISVPALVVLWIIRVGMTLYGS